VASSLARRAALSRPLTIGGRSSVPELQRQPHPAREVCAPALHKRGGGDKHGVLLDSAVPRRAAARSPILPDQGVLVAGLPTASGSFGHPGRHVSNHEAAAAASKDPAANGRVAKATDEPPPVLFASSREHVQHHEINLVGERDVLEVISGEKGAKAFGKRAPARSRCRAGDLGATACRESLGSSASARRPALLSAPAVERDGMRVLHRPEFNINRFKHSDLQGAGRPVGMIDRPPHCALLACAGAVASSRAGCRLGRGLRFGRALLGLGVEGAQLDRGLAHAGRDEVEAQVPGLVAILEGDADARPGGRLRRAGRTMQPRAEPMPHGRLQPMDPLARITHDPRVMGGRPCIRGLRMTVGTILGLLAAGKSAEDILTAYPYLEPDDIRAALSYAAWRAEEVELPLSP